MGSLDGLWSNKSLILGLEFDLITRRVTELAATTSGVKTWRFPLPTNRPRDGDSFFAGVENPRGRICVLDLGEARYGEYEARIGITEFNESLGGCDTGTIAVLVDDLSSHTLCFSNSFLCSSIAFICDAKISFATGGITVPAAGVGGI